MGLQYIYVDIENYNDGVTATSATTYCTAESVWKDFLLRGDYTTKVTAARIEKIINRMEDLIDQHTGQAWRTTTATEEYYTAYSNEKVYISNLEHSNYGVRIFLKKRNIKSWNSVTDKLEYWNGSSWIDISTGTESKTGDFYILYKEGVVDVYNILSLYQKGIRITYRYGITTIPKDIERACILLTAAEILTVQDADVVMEAGSITNMSLMDRVTLWREEAYKIIDRHKEFYSCVF